MERRISAWHCGAAGAGVAIALYAVTLWGTFIYDDRWVVQQDPRLHSAAGWKQYLTRAYIEDAADNLWRPLTSLTYWAQYQTGTAQPWALHAVNVLLMAGVCWLVGVLGCHLAGARAGLAAAVLFAAHPVHVEAVAYLVGRAETLCAVFLLGAMVLLWKRPLTMGRAVGCFGCAMMAMLCKEQGVLAPLLLVALWWARGGEREKAERRALLVLALLFLWGWASYIVYRERMLPWAWEVEWIDWTINPVVRAEGWSRVGLPFALLGRCAALLVAPVKLSPEYGAAVIMPTLSPADPYLWIGCAAVVIWLAALTWSWRRGDRVMVFALAGMALTWGVVSNVMLIGVGFGERLAFKPSIFFVLLVAHLGARVERRWIGLVAGVVVVLMAVRTVSYAARWDDRESFYRVSLAEQPRSMQLRLLVNAELLERARALRGRGDQSGARQALEESKRLLVEGRALLPDYHRIWAYSAETAFELGEYDQAEVFARRAFDLNAASLAAVHWIDQVHKWRATTQPARP